ncbi:MAG: PKD domain-containing protein [Bacteroidetes bacterium]|nr:PKD domain-containing protein [Bacteroidota bacterium]
MKNLIFTGVTFILLLSATGCKKANGPETCIVPSDVHGTWYKPVQFGHCTRDATRYLWTFGDGDTSMRPFPTHIYTDTGTYVATFTPGNAAAEGRSASFRVIIENTGWWTFKGIHYANESYGTMIASKYGECTYGDSIITLSVHFSNSLPSQSGYFTVTDSPLTRSDQVLITMEMNGYEANPPFRSTKGNGQNIVSVFVSGLGDIRINGRNIEMANSFNKADSALLDFELIH